MEHEETLDGEVLPRVAAPPSLPAHPRLLVDWGELPRVGYQCRPEFVLLSPAFSGVPEIHVKVDADLDAQSTDSRVRPLADGAGFWTFHLPFRMTTQGCDCRPGQYLLEVSITFHDVPTHLPRFFLARIRLNVAGNHDGVAGVLEIEGDGQSVVNLQGYDLRQFSKVVLKGGQDGVINLANSSFGAATTEQPIGTKAPTSFEYHLKVDQQRQQRLPQLCLGGRPRPYMESLGLCFADQRRVLLFARPRLSFGRSRDNDVVLRFFPRSSENDNHSLIISRTHFTAELKENGVEIHDQSKSGIEVSGSIVKERREVPRGFVGDGVPVDLGVTATVPKQFSLQATLLGPDRRQWQEDVEFWEELLCEIVGSKPTRVARLALATGIDAVRYDRCTSLAGEESYVHLYRDTLVGSSTARCGVLLRQCGPQPIARIRYIDRTFWLESLDNPYHPVQVDGVSMAGNQWVPLGPGMQVAFGSEVAQVERPQQLYLD